MTEKIRVSLPDGSAREFSAGTTVLEVAEAIGPRLARDTIAGMVDGQLVDLRTPIRCDTDLRIVTAKDPEAGDVIRHSAEHVLADAVKRLWPGTPIDAGRRDHSEKYQYDFRFPRPFRPEDFERIEEEMARIISEGLEFERREADRDEVRRVMTERGEDIKLIRLEDIPEDDTITLYSHGPFLDLSTCAAARTFSAPRRSVRYGCSRPPAPTSRATSVTKCCSASTAPLSPRRRSSRPTSPASRSSSAVTIGGWAASSIFSPSTPRRRRARSSTHGGRSFTTPSSSSDDMFFADAFDEVEERSASIKPMNCPSHCLLYGGRAHSYRELPLRIADFGRLHRYERSGVVTGLTRVRTFSQDDAHIFCTPEQIEAEMTALFDFVFEIYDLFDFSDVRVYLSTRPEKAMGDPKVWEHAEAVLARCLDDRQDLNYTVKPGEGAFYGPKIDFDIHDALGRSWQLATIQLDFQMPERFDLTYVDSDGSEKRPVMIHRAILGSLERFYAVMLEHFGGNLPPWLAPEQARVLPVTDEVNDYAEGVASGLRACGLRVEVDRRSEKLGYKIRDGETQKVPYLLVVGQREAEKDTVSLRLRHRRDEGVKSVDEVADRITHAVNTRSLEL